MRKLALVPSIPSFRSNFINSAEKRKEKRNEKTTVERSNRTISKTKSNIHNYFFDNFSN
jgi:hypothetical protein